MPELPPSDREKAILLLTHLREQIRLAANDNPDLIFQIKRYIAKRLEFDERGTPTQRRKLKDLMRKRQHGLCALCQTKLPERGAELDRFVAIEGYTAANTQLLCRDCHHATQEARDRHAAAPPPAPHASHPKAPQETSMRVLGTFQSRDAADSVKDAFIDEGFNPADLIVIANREKPEPPEDADVEAGTEGEGGFAEFEEKLGKAVQGMLHHHQKLEGDGTEGDPKGGALLSIAVRDQPQADLAKALLERHFASDIEETDLA
jgi:hypothetical protein